VALITWELVLSTAQLPPALVVFLQEVSAVATGQELSNTVHPAAKVCF
jgi:hypothetical protein